MLTPRAVREISPTHAVCRMSRGDVLVKVCTTRRVEIGTSRRKCYDVRNDISYFAIRPALAARAKYVLFFTRVVPVDNLLKKHYTFLLNSRVRSKFT